jgi:Arc/MetJ family transcription regulator
VSVDDRLIGGIETLVTRRALTSHAGLPPDERRAIGIADALVRVSVGIEAGAPLEVCRPRGRGIRMSVKRKSHNLDEALLRRAKRVLGASTETEAIHGALRAVLIGEDIVRDLEAARGKDVLRPEFVRQMRAERRRAG